MRKIINFIVLILFLTTLVPNYLYSDKESNKDDKLKLISGLITGHVADVVFDDLDEIIGLSCDGGQEDVVEELVKTYTRIGDSTDIIESMDIETIDNGDVIDVEIKIKARNRKEPYINQITIDDLGFIEWDTPTREIKRLVQKFHEKLNPADERIYIESIKRRLKEYFKKQELTFLDKDAISSVFEGIAERILKVKEAKGLLPRYLELLQSADRAMGSEPYDERFRKPVDKVITRLTDIIKPKQSGRKGKIKKKKPFFKSDIIKILCSLYKKTGIKDNKKNFKTLADQIEDDFHTASDGIDKYRYINLLLSIIIENKEYSTYKSSTVDPIIKNMIQTLKSAKKKVSLKKHIVILLGIIAQGFIRSGFHKVAHNLIIKPLKDGIKPSKGMSKFPMQIREEAINQLYLIGKEFIERASLKNKYLKKAKGIESYLQKLKQDKVAVDGYIKSLKRDRVKKNKVLGRGKEDVKKSPQRKVQKTTKKSDKKKKKPMKRKRYRRRARKKRDVFGQIEPEIELIAAKSGAKNILKNIREHEYKYEYYNIKVVPLVEELRKIKAVDEIIHEYDDFVVHIKKLCKELKSLGFKKLRYSHIIDSFETLSDSLDILQESIKTWDQRTKSIEKNRKIMGLNNLDTFDLKTLPGRTRVCLYKINYDSLASLPAEIFKKLKINEEHYQRMGKKLVKKILHTKLEEITGHYKALGMGDEKEVKELVKIMKELDADKEFYFNYATMKGSIKKFEDEKLVKTIEIGGIKYVVNMIHNRPRIIYIETGLYNDAPEFEKLELAFRQSGRVKFDYISGNKDLKRKIDELMRPLCELCKQRKWPQNREELERIVEYIELFKNLTGLEYIELIYFLSIISTDLLNIYKKAYTEIHEFTTYHIDDGVAIKDRIQKKFRDSDTIGIRFPYFGYNKKIEKVIVIALLDIPISEMKRIADTLKKDQQLIFIVQSESVRYKGVRWTSKTKNILGEDIDLNIDINNLEESLVIMSKKGDAIILRGDAPEEVKGSLFDIPVKTRLLNIDEKLLESETETYHLISRLKKTELEKYELIDADFRWINTVRQILLFLAVEANDKRVVERIIKEGVALDIQTEDRKELFDTAYKIAQENSDYSIFDLLASNIESPYSYKEEVKEKIVKFIRLRKNMIMNLYKPELAFLMRLRVMVDPIKDLNKLKMLNKARDIFKTDIEIGELILTKKMFQELVFSIYNKLDHTPELEELKLLKAAV